MQLQRCHSLLHYRTMEGEQPEGVLQELGGRGEGDQKAGNKATTPHPTSLSMLTTALIPKPPYRTAGASPLSAFWAPVWGGMEGGREASGTERGPSVTFSLSFPPAGSTGLTPPPLYNGAAGCCTGGCGPSPLPARRGRTAMCGLCVAMVSREQITITIIIINNNKNKREKQNNPRKQ